MYRDRQGCTVHCTVTQELLHQILFFRRFARVTKCYPLLPLPRIQLQITFYHSIQPHPALSPWKMLTFNQTLQKIEDLCNNCPGLREGTRKDQIYRTFCNAAVPDDDEGMWYSVNTDLDTAFGTDCIQKNISKGPLGLPMVVEWVRNARNHHTWDADCDKLVKIKLDNIITALKGESL